MSALTRRLLIGFALLGAAASGAATYVHYHLIRNPDYSSFCDFNATVSCKAAYLSRFGSMAGVPVAVGGLIFFTWVLLLLWGSRGKSRIEDSAPAYIFAGSALALAVVLYLAYASFFILKEVCPLCVTTYVAVIALFLISGGVSSLPISRLPARALRDVRLMVTTPGALIIAVVFIGAGAWAAGAFPREDVRPAVQQLPALTSKDIDEFDRWWDLQPVKADFPYKNDGAKVVVVEFADFQCPHCKLMYFALKPVLDKYLSEHPKDVSLVFKTWPLSAGCNASVPGDHFTASCAAAAAYLMAKPAGKADTLKDWFFLHQDDLSPATVRTAAADVGGVANFDAQYPQALQTVKADAAVGTTLGVNSTPTFFVNGRRIPEGGLPPQYFDHLIDLELKRAK